VTPADSTDVNSSVQAQVDPASRTSAAAPVPHALTPLTGRNTEVSLLTDRWEQAEEGMGQVVLIVGDAGLGKSRLVQTIKQAVLDKVCDDAGGAPSVSPIIEWRCSNRFQSTGLFPIADYLQRIFEFGREETTSTQFDRLAQYLDDCGLGRPEIVALFAKLLFLPPDERYPPTGLSPAREREETFRVVHEWLRACSHRHPILFVVEDLHWVDASTLEFLEQFIAEGLHDRILTVLTFRPEFRTPWPAMAHQTSLALNRLTRRQVGELMLKTVGSELPDTLVGQIYERTGGVPLLVEEFSRMAQESAIFGKERAREMPTTLQQLVMARLDRMSSNREVAHFAATLGREFPYEMLAAVVAVDEETLCVELAKLERAEIVYRKGQPPRCTYLFKHTLLEEAVRSALAEPEQRQLHRQVADAMEARFPQLVETQPEQLAQHFTKAGNAERAVSYWLRAGLRSHERFANIEAINHLTKGLELLRTLDESPARDARELELLGPLGTAYIAARGYAAPEVEPVFHRARDLAERSGQTPQAFVMMRGYFAYQVVRGNFRLCKELAAQAVQFAERSGDPGMLMEALFLQGVTALYRGDFTSAHDYCTRALADFDDRARTAFWATQTGENSGVAHRCYLALACWHLGFPNRALALNREARELARAIHHPFSLEYALHHTGWLHQHCRLGAQAEVAGEEQMRVAIEQGFDFWHATGTLHFAVGLLLGGQSEQGLRVFQDGLAAYRATGAVLGLPYYLSILGEAFTKAGRFDNAHRAFAEALDLVEQNDERFQEAELHRLRGELHLAESNDESAAAACFQRAIEVAGHLRSRAFGLRATVSLAQLWHRQGRGREALNALTTAFELFDEGFETPDLAEAAALIKEWDNEFMRDDVAAGIKYVRGCIPPPMDGTVSVDWRYIPSSTLGGDAIGYHWVDEEHLALYLIDVTGHGLDSALLSVTITNVIRSGSLAGADPRMPNQVLAALNEAFQGSRHGYKFFTLWYGVYHTASRTLTYASGGHPSAIAIVPTEFQPLVFPATGPVMGISPGVKFGAVASPIPPGARLFIFSDGIFEVRRERRMVWNLAACIAHLSALGQREENVMDALLAHVRELHGSAHLDDDFSIIEVRLR
jgi:serine phosphatase RsbU (regulator of sigma subunit)